MYCTSVTSPHTFFSSFAFHVGPRGSPFLPGRTPANSAKGKLNHSSWNHFTEVYRPFRNVQLTGYFLIFSRPVCSQCSKKVRSCRLIYEHHKTAYSVKVVLKIYLLIYLCIFFLPQMRLPSKPYSTLPIYSLGPSTMAKEEASGACAPAEPDKHPFGSGQSRHSLRRSVYK